MPLLISMGEAELALRKAIASGDTDLVYLVLLHIKRTHTPQAFFGALRDKPVAMSLLIAYCTFRSGTACVRLTFAPQAKSKICRC